MMQAFAPDEIKYTYSPDHPPIGSVAAGETFSVETEDCFTARFRDPADFTPESAAWVEANLDGVTGPIAVDGVPAGGALAVEIESIEVTTPGCVVVSRCDARDPAAWWHEEDHVVNLRIADGRIELRDGWSVPARPLIGCLATSPERETVLSRHEGEYVGNVDIGEIAAGATVLLPAALEGGRLYFGDCKAAMGDGEVVCAPEIGTRIVARAWPVPRPARMEGPRVIDDASLTTFVSGISLADACRAAFRELKHWLQDDVGLSGEDAAILMGIGAHCGVGQVSNRLHTGKCSISRDLLPDGGNRVRRLLQPPTGGPFE